MDTEETIWVEDDLGVDITLNPHPFPFPAAYSEGVVSAISVPTAIEAEFVEVPAPAAEEFAKQEAYEGLGLYIAFNADNNAEYVVLRTDMAHMLDGFRVR